MSNLNLENPLKPDEIVDSLDIIIPKSIIKAVNMLLMDKYRGKPVSIKQKDIIKKALELDNDLNRDKIFDNNYLDFESLFKKSGWDVSYESPSYGDNNFDSYFSFKKSKR